MIRHIDQRSLGTISDLSSFPHSKDFLPDSSNTNNLCGRTTATLTLLKTYQDILHSRNGPLSKGLIVVHGESGSGKTSLVDVLRDPVSASNGYFCVGKFFQQSMGDDPLVSQEPYSAIMAAFSDLCDLVLQSSDFDVKQRIEIQQDLGPDSDLLVRAISNLSPFFDDSQYDLQFGHFDTTNSATVTRFTNACKRFLHAMSSSRHPIVLFIDDIQWMDDGSRQLIDVLLKDDKLQNVLLIFAYRDEDADSISDVFSCELNAVDIAVNNLDAGSVQQLLSSLLGSPPSQFPTLIDVVMSRTCGNPFHVIQFIETIRSEDLLVFDAARSMWIFDIFQIKKEMTVSETLCALLSRRICNMVPVMQEVLKIASLIGYSFTKQILINVASVELTAKHLTSDQLGLTNLQIVDSMLVMAIEQGFIEFTKNMYHFSHDKLQDSFQNMVEPSDLARYHYLIGNQYVFHCQSDDAIFQAAIHLNKAGNYALSRERRDKLARINLEAAKRCRDKSAFDNAARFLRHGLKLLDEDSHDKWAVCFNLAFEISESLAKMELILGNLDACKQINNELILHSKSLQMRIRPLVIDVEVKIAGNEMVATIQAAKHALRELGFIMPHCVTVVNMLSKLGKVRRLVKHKGDEDILGLPRMLNHNVCIAVKLLIRLCMYSLMQDKGILAVYTALYATELIMRKGGGLSQYSATCFTIYGMAEVRLGNVHNGIRFGELAMKLIDKIPCKETECPTLVLLLSGLRHWKTHIRSLDTMLVKALNSGFEVGDMVYGTLCIATCWTRRYMLGENLGSLERFVRSWYIRLTDLGQDAMIRWIQPFMQFTLNMQMCPALWQDVLILSGEVMDEAEYISEAIATKHKLMLFGFLNIKSLLAYSFGYYERAEREYQNMACLARVHRDSFAAIPYHFYGAMIFYQRYRTTRKVKHLTEARKHIKSLKRFEAVGSPNVSSYLVFAKAEEFSLKSRDGKALVSVYSEAIDAIKVERFVHLEALANERLSVILSSLGWHEESNTCLDKALRLCRDEWGAVAKYEWLLTQRKMQFDTVNGTSLRRPLDEIHV